jgi:hypothetical protein
MNDDELAAVVGKALTQGRYEREDLYVFDTKLAWQMTNEAHVRDPEQAMVSSAIQTHPDVAPILDKHLNGVLNAPRFSAPALAGWLLTRAFWLGPGAAVAELRTFIDSPLADLDECLAFSGLAARGESPRQRT